jgi:hypothetical protein
MGAAAVVVLVALVLVVRWLRARRAHGLSVALLDALARAASPAGRVWIDGMRAELHAIEDPAQRRGFTRGCLWAFLIAPAGDDSGTLLRVTTIGCLFGAAGLGVFAVLHYPALRDDRAWIVWVTMFGCGLVLYGIAAFQIAKLAPASTQRIGIIAGLPAIMAAAYAASSNSAVSVAAAMAPTVLPAIAALWSLRTERNTARALVAASTCALIAGLAFFSGFAGATYATSSGTPTAMMLREYATSGIHNYRAWTVGDNLGGACFMLIVLPLVGLALAVFACNLAPWRGRPATA